MKIGKLNTLAAFAGALAFVSTTQALTIGDLTFTAESGAVTLDNLTGSGTLADPFVLHETVSGEDVTIRIDGMDEHGNSSGSFHTSGFRLRKVITNNTGSNWTLYDNELQEILGVASQDGDGLSFAQDADDQRPFVGNPLSTVVEIDTIRDYVNFSGGIVAPGGVLTIEYTITDNSPIDTVYLRQRPNVDFTGERVPEAGSTLALAGAAVGVLSFLRRKLA